MALVLIRADNQRKLLNTLADIERHAKLKIVGKPRIMYPEKADKLVENILKQKLRVTCHRASIIKVAEDSTKSIMQVRKIHPPGHVMVISKEYREFEVLKHLFNKLPILKGYYSLKSVD
ncbi:MAG: DUF356 domain-containing protein [Euryarchaeota archaeon]|nr:DUF356 domain-containing protein [Euryarchaeota archaeon]